MVAEVNYMDGSYLIIKGKDLKVETDQLRNLIRIDDEDGYIFGANTESLKSVVIEGKVKWHWTGAHHIEEDA